MIFHIQGINILFLLACSQVLDKLYMETATMVWNGNLVEGSKEIVKFLETLPVSEHTIDLLDCHPILGEFKFMDIREISLLQLTKYENAFQKKEEIICL